MSTASNIEWTDTTWNPVAGCAKVSAGCKHCYAETMAARHVLMTTAQGRTSPYLPVVDAERRRWRGNFITLPERLADPLSWRKPRRVFVNSMSDLFGEDVPFEFIAAVFGVMAATSHTYQVLTKRPQRMVEFFAWMTATAARASIDGRLVDLATIQALIQLRHDRHVGEISFGGVERWPLPNVWLGVSTEDQATADERIPLLLEVPAAVRFISAEPLLGPITLFAECMDHVPRAEGHMFAPAPGMRRRHSGWSGDVLFEASDEVALDWVIVGGESGPGARVCKVSWVRDLVRQCSEAGVPVFVKQLGARPDFVEPLAGGGQSIESMLRGDPAEWPEDLRVRQFPGGAS